MQSTIKFRALSITSGEYREGFLVATNKIKLPNGGLTIQIQPDTLEMSFGMCWIPIGVAQEFLDFSLNYDEVEDSFLIDDSGLQFKRDFACSVEKATTQRIEAMNEVADEIEELLDPTSFEEEDVLG